MSFFKNIRIELLILFIVSISIFISNSLDFQLYKYFKDIDTLNNGVYLKEFFEDITRLGSSLSYFIISIFGFVIFYLNSKLEIIKINGFKKINNFFISSFFYLLIVGVITQIGKHLVGRARPNYTNFEDTFNFNFFTVESSFHSFPSGHSSTIFMVCFILISTFPKLKYFFYLLASIVALSRVVVGAHFFTDIVAGALLALITFKVLNNILEKKFDQFKFSEVIFSKNSEFYYFFLFLLIGCLFITVGPSLDLYVAGLFYKGASQFYLQSFDILSIFFRDIFLPFILIYILIVPVVGYFIKIDRLYFGYKFSLKEIFLIWVSQIICVLIFTNLILKNLWGRARPNDILELGGQENFSIWYKLSDACDTNCSFVSGDASVGFSVIILYFITKKNIFIYFSIIFGFLLGLVRIMAGGHFLSDVFFAGIFMIILNILVFEIFKKNYVR